MILVVLLMIIVFSGINTFTGGAHTSYGGSGITVKDTAFDAGTGYTGQTEYTACSVNMIDKNNAILAADRYTESSTKVMRVMHVKNNVGSPKCDGFLLLRLGKSDNTLELVLLKSPAGGTPTQTVIATL